jgi:hypothetical protein
MMPKYRTQKVRSAQPPRLLDRERVEAEYGLRWRTALSWAKDGLLKVIRIGRKCYFDREEIDRIIAEGGRRFAGGWRREPINP